MTNFTPFIVFLIFFGNQIRCDAQSKSNNIYNNTPYLSIASNMQHELAIGMNYKVERYKLSYNWMKDAFSLKGYGIYNLVHSGRLNGGLGFGYYGKSGFEKLEEEKKELRYALGVLLALEISYEFHQMLVMRLSGFLDFDLIDNYTDNSLNPYWYLELALRIK